MQIKRKERRRKFFPALHFVQTNSLFFPRNLTCILDFYSRETVSLQERKNAYGEREGGGGNLFPPCTHFKRIRFSWESPVSWTFTLVTQSF